MYHTQESKLKMSAKRKGRTHSAETRKKMSEAHKGLRHTEEAKTHLSESKKGRIWINNGERQKMRHAWCS